MSKLKKILGVVLSLTMAANGVIGSAGITKAAPKRVNFAQNKSVTASHNDGNGPEKAVDGSLSTRWGTDPYGTNQWLRVDLGEELEFDEFYIASENSNAQKMRKFKIEGSSDDTQYEMIYNSEDKTSGFDLETTIKLEDPVQYQYVRITVESLISGAYPSVSLREFQVIGNEASNVTDVKQALDELEVPGKVYHDFYIPSENADLGVSFKWESFNDAIAVQDNQAVIQNISETTESGLRVTASKDGYEETREFHFKVYADVSADYEVYPLPQKMTYGEGSFALEEDVHVAIPDTMDINVKNYADRVLKEYQYNCDFSSEKAEGTNILLGIAGDKGPADEYFANVSYDKAASTDVNEGYVLSVASDKNTVAILGHDSSGVFNGLSTLRQMLESSRMQLKDVVIEDAPDTLFRGIVEGFYGEYSFEERMDLIQFIGPLKMNTYIYGSKSDPYHNGKWREPYPEREINQIKQLVECGKENNVELVWTAHVGGHINMSAQADYDALVAKFDQLYDVGVRQFGLFYDDAGTDNTYLTEFINKLNREYIHQKDGVKSLIMCPQHYNKNQANDAYFAKLAAFDEDVQVMWTGDAVISAVSPSMMEYIESKINRPAYIWWNYPVNDLGLGDQLLVGETVGLSTEMGKMNGLVSNPMLQAQASKFSLFSIADYSWNIADFDKHASWDRAVDYIIEEKEYADAFKIFSANNNQSVAELKDESVESEYLIERFNKIRSDYASGADIEAQAMELKEEFKKIEDACNLLKTYHNRALVSQMTPWMDRLLPIVVAGQKVMDNFARLSSDSILDEATFTAIRNDYVECQQTLQNIGGRWSGRREIVPFLQDVQAVINQRMQQELGYGEVMRPITNYRNGAYLMSDLSAMLDKNNGSAVRFEEREVTGKWFGVDLGSVKDIHSLEILLGASENDQNVAPEYKVQVSDDKETWKDIEVVKNNNIITNVNNEKGRFVRYYVVTGSNQNTQVREFFVNRTDKTIYTNVEEYKNLTVNETNRDISLDAIDSFVLQPGEYVGIQFDTAKKIPSVEIDDGLKAEYSVDGVNWNVCGGEEMIARFVRVINDTEQAYSGKLEKFVLNLSDAVIPTGMSVSNTGLTTWSGSQEQIVDGNRGTYHWTRNQQTGNGYTIDMKQTIMLYDVTVVMGDGDYMESGVIEVSTDNTNWQEVGTVNGKQVTTVYPQVEGRYIRVRMTANSDNWLKFAEVEINQLSSSVDAPLLDKEEANHAIDGNVSTAYNVPNTAGEFIYNNYKNPNATRLHVLKNAEGTMKVESLFDGAWKEIEGSGTELVVYDFKDLGMASQIKVSWDNNANLSIYELVFAQEEKTEEPDDSALAKFKELLQKTYDYALLQSTDGVADSAVKFFEEAKENAKAVLADDNATWEEVEKAWSDLLDGIWGLGIVQGDKTELKSLIDQAKLMKEEDYLPDNWPMLVDALAKAEEVYESKDATADVIEEAVKALQEAIDAQKLKPTEVDKTALKLTIDRAESMLPNADKYVEKYWKQLLESLAKGIEVYEDSAATQEEVDQACGELLRMILAQRLKADKLDLEMALELAEKINLDNYVEAGQAEFLAAVERAKEVMADETLEEEDQQIVDDAWQTLMSTMEALRLKANKDALEELLKWAEGLNLEGYPEEAVQAFRTALAKATEVMEDATLSEKDQQIVDDAVKALADAKDALESKNESNTNNKSDAPKTGDTTSVLFLMMLSVVSVLTAFSLKKRKVNR